MVYYSHFDKELFVHLNSVAENSRQTVLSKKLDLNTIEKDKLAEISYIIGLLHDLGKSLNSFQEIFKPENKDKNVVHDNHSPISSYISYYVLNEYCKQNKINNIFSFLGSQTIKKHHGDLDNLTNLFETFKLNELEKQHQEILDKKEIILFYNEKLRYANLDFENILLQIEIKERSDKVIYDSLHIDKDSNNHIELFLIEKLLFSILLDSDKKEAANIINYKVPSIQFDISIVDNYLSKLALDYPARFDLNLPINKLKNEFKSTILKHEINPNKKLYTLTAPTGIGKTLASFEFSIRLQNIIPENMKIIYVLPYTSIIDQTYSEFKKALIHFYGAEFEDNESEYIIKNHHLSLQEVKSEKYANEFKSKGYNSENYLNELLVMDSWDSNLIVSTYVQLLLSIFSDKNKFSIKFHNLCNSIIILDEVQFIEDKYWKLLNNVFNILSERFNVYFVLMTATQPLIFKTEAEELSNPDFFKNKLISKKVDFKIINQDKTITGLFDLFNANFQLNNKNKYLFILNTKKSSLELFNQIEKSGNFKDYNLFYLSTLLCPKDRIDKIDKIVALSKINKSKYIIVSTQLIEAGVDITSDECYTDISTIDSLAQRAGRCNRYNEIEKGSVYIINSLVNENDKNREYISYILKDSFILPKVKKLLIDTKTFDVKEIVDSFFGEIESHQITSVLDDFSSLAFERISDSFKIIDEEMYTESVFLINVQSKSLFNNYKELIISFKDIKKEELFIKLGDLKKVKIKMQNYFVDIDKKLFSNLLNTDYVEKYGKLFFIDLEKYPDLYNPETGLSLQKDSASIT
ncbi:MAG: CRISPR-associated helicase Cas3' [archaeon]